MFDSKDIIKAMREGASADDIAKSFGNALKEAKAQMENEQVQTERKKQAAWDVYTTIVRFYETCYPEFKITTKERVTDLPAKEKESLIKEVISALESAGKSTSNLYNFITAKGPFEIFW
jgi:hypothetical protein